MWNKDAGHISIYIDSLNVKNFLTSNPVGNEGEKLWALIDQMRSMHFATVTVEQVRRSELSLSTDELSGGWRQHVKAQLARGQAGDV